MRKMSTSAAAGTSGSSSSLRVDCGCDENISCSSLSMSARESRFACKEVVRVGAYSRTDRVQTVTGILTIVARARMMVQGRKRLVVSLS